MMSLAIGLQGRAWWLNHAQPDWMLRQRLHLLSIRRTLIFSLNDLCGDVPLWVWRWQDRIVERHAQERGEGLTQGRARTSSQ